MIASFPWRHCLLLPALLWLLLPCLARAEGQTRTYYIAAEAVLWDYAPSWPDNPITGSEFTEPVKKRLKGNSNDRIGRKYWKAVYRAYTDDTFTTRKPRPPEWEHLGILGPPLRAITGDTIRVVFRNRLEERAVSLYAHGLRYAKDAEGAAYNDGTAGLDREDDAVAPGETRVYTWEVPARSGPGPADPGSVVWTYHSHVHPEADINAGLIGPVIISRRFQARKDTSPADAEREFVSLFAVFDENASFLAARNRKQMAPLADPDDEAFRRSNRMHAVNGYLYGNLPGLTVGAGEHVRWHVLSPGRDGLAHAAHWHGNAVTAYGRHTDTVPLPPGTRASVTMETDNPGTWLYQCTAGDHAAAGMSALYTVTE